MSRRALRWTILFTLMAGVVALAVYNAYSNARLLSDLESRDPAKRASGFALLSDRQDGYNLVQTLPAGRRRAVAEALGDWRSPKAASLAATLLRDTDAGVRTALTRSLSRIAAESPESVAMEMSATTPEVRVGLLEAAYAAGDTGLQIAATAFQNTDSRENAATLFVRFGDRAKPALTRLLDADDTEAALVAAETLSRIGAGDGDSEVGARIWVFFTGLESVEEKDRAFAALAEFAPPPAEGLFIKTLQDAVAPSSLRAASARALGRLGNFGPLAAALADTDRAVWTAAAEGFAGADELGASLAAVAEAPPERSAMALRMNPSPLAERFLTQRALKGDAAAVRALGERPNVSPGGLLALERILSMAEGADEGLRRDAARALAAHGTEGGEILLRNLSNPEASWPAADALATSEVPDGRLEEAAEGDGPGAAWAALALRIRKGSDS
ncbi:MAG: hypothetical protein IH851_07940 [Armatimonadetes bacterium]|nr:hypothetical protein [Armatimonadota bacterium]